MSITNILAIAMLSGPLQCPPPSEAVSTTKTADVAPVVGAQLQPPVQNASSGIAASNEVAPVTMIADAPAAMNETQIGQPGLAIITEEQAQAPDLLTTPNVITPAANDPATIIVTARQGPPPGDPIAVVNEASFVAVQAIDEAFVAPVARGYQKGLPEPIRDGLHNVLNNLDEPIVFVNFLLQLKIGKAVETVGRFAINSTVGVAGLFDVAKKKPFKLPRRSNGLADTLGYYGVGPGPYLFLPLIGSTSVRDLFGRVADLSLLPTTVGKPFTNPIVSTSKGILSSIDDRVENDEILTRLQQSGNPYAATREYYLKKRQAEIDVLKGKRCNSDINLDELEFMDSVPASKKPSVAAPVAIPTP